MPTRGPKSKKDNLLKDLLVTSIASERPKSRQSTANRIEYADIPDQLEEFLKSDAPGEETFIASVKALGSIVQANRIMLRLSQQELADMAGVGRRFVSELENGKATLEIGRVLKVCQALGVDLVARKR